MTKIISVVNQKGGVGKTTTSISVASSLADQLNKKVLIIDLDPQGNTSSGLGIDKSDQKFCVYNSLIGEVSLNDIIIKSSIQGLDILPATIQLAGAEIELVNEINRENKLKRSLQNILDNYDYIIIDCPPSLGLLTINALSASTHILIPLQCEYFALEGLTQLLNTFTLIKGDLNPDLKIAGILLTMADNRTNLTTQIIEEVNEHFPYHVFETIISRNVRLSESPSHGIPIHIYDAKSSGAKAYFEFSKELDQCLQKED
ncbi:MAG: sporulation initiation inhibitor Soj [Candidatus Cloacimonadota bacterium]|nr:MAG: sporulation initiation inhibitor Soj [Candidatus Cloacimonadota bacterium]